MSKLAPPFVGLALAALTFGDPTHAADQALLGKKLVIKNPPAGTTANKVVYLAKDPAVVVGAAGGAGDPQCSGLNGGGGILRVLASGGAGEVTIPLPCDGWTTNAANTRYRYKDPTGATCKVVLVKAGVLTKTVCKGPQLAIDVSGDTAPVTVVATLNTEQYCSVFGGTATKNGSDDVTLLHRDAAAPAGCPALECPYVGPPLVDPSSLPACVPACGGAHCVATSLLPDSQEPLLAACDAGGGTAGVCAPDALIASLGNFVPTSCVSMAGAEGRCLSTCTALVEAQGELLPSSTCAADELCAPCYNPIATDPNVATGACSLACDAPSQPPVTLACPWFGPDVVNPSVLPACAPACSGAHCAPKSMVPVGQQSLFASCDDGDGICAPDPIIETFNHSIPQSCVSMAGAEGRCLSTCLPFVEALAELLPIGTCGAGERCTPCFNPIATDPLASTGACSLACDAPSQEPTVVTCPWFGPDVVNPSSLPDCSPACGGSHCAPKSMVPVGQQSLFASCDDGEGICAPDSIIETFNNTIPQSCISIGGAEGRCLSTCLPFVQAQAGVWPIHVCAADQRCAPCFDPNNGGAATGACSFGCDQPQLPPP